MIDNVAYGLKVIFFVVGAYQFYRLRMSWLIALAIPFFMTGVEMISLRDSPWEHLFSSSANYGDYETALVGGALFTLLPVLLVILCGKDMAKLLELEEPATIEK